MGGGAQPGARRRWSWVAYLLCALGVLLFLQVTIPGFQEERALARELERVSAESRRLEELRAAYELRARALQEDPQERFKLYLEWRRLGLVR